MARFPQKTKVAVAAGRNNKFDLSNQNVFTTNFGILRPCYVNDLVPKDSFHIRSTAMCRTAPLALPTFGRFLHSFDSFKVEYYKIWRGWNKFYTTEKSNSGNIIDMLPYFTSTQVKKLFADTTNGFASTVVSGAYDFEYQVTSAGLLIKYKLTDLGARVQSLLISLGYGDVLNIPGAGDALGIRFNAFRLLAFVRIYLDWYAPALYINPGLRSVIDTVRDDVDSVGISDSQLKSIFEYDFFRSYEPDYFTSAWETPSGINSDDIQADDWNTIYSKFIPENVIHESLNEDTTVYHKAGFNSVGASLVSQGSSSYPEFTQIVSQNLDVLSRMQQFLRRAIVGGQRSVNRYLTQYGVVSDSVKNDYSVLCNHNTSEMLISDVMSMADTNSASGGARLGEYGGKAIMADNNQWSVDTDDFAVIMSIHSIMPKVGYFEGVDRQNLVLSNDQVFQPEFDGVGVDGIANIELESKHSNSTSVFGYAPRFAFMKVGKDIVSGDFRVKSRGADSLEGWHGMRIIEGSSFYNGESFRKIDGSDWNRIFQVQDNVDHFYLFVNNEVMASRPMLHITDMYELTHPDDHTPHKSVNVQYNGRQL